MQTKITATSSSANRPRGRPVDSKQDRKTLILDAAEQLFTEYGYSATSIRNIADHADVNPALVHYYFDNKHILLKTVLERALKPMIVALATLKRSTQSSLADIVHLLVSMAAQQPNIPRLLAREVLLPGGEMQAHFMHNLAPQLGGALPALLAREQKAGNLRDAIDPAYSALMILAVCFFPFIAQTLAEPVLGIDFGDTGAPLLIDNILELFNRGLVT